METSASEEGGGGRGGGCAGRPQSPEENTKETAALYYRKLERDKAVLEKARKLSISPVDEERGTPTEGMEGETSESSQQRRKLHWRSRCNQLLSVATATRLTLSANLLLFFIKMAASIQSGSLAIVSSLVDSTLDLFSGVVIAVG